MKQFIIKGLIVIVGIVIIDFFVGLIGEKLIVRLCQKNYNGVTALLGYNIQSATADIVVLGSSTATCHYIPRILSDSLSVCFGEHLTAFNAGAYYQQPSYSYCVLKSMIQRRKPRIVIVDIQPQQLGGAPLVEALKPLRPYYRANNNVREVLDENESTYDKLLLNVNMFRFNTEIIKIITSFGKSVGADGYDPRYGVVDRFEIIPKYDKNEINPIVDKEFRELVKIAQDNEILLFVSMSPRLVYTDKNSKSYQEIIGICDAAGVPVFDFTTEDFFQNGKYFDGLVHLNNTGAEMLTFEVVKSIKIFLEERGRN